MSAHPNVTFQSSTTIPVQPHKLFTLLKALNRDEWNGLKRYHLLHTSEGSDINRLFLFCRKHIDKISKDQLTIADVEEKVLRSNSHKSVLNALSTLKIIVDEYLIHYDLINDKEARELALTHAYNKRKLYSWANKKLSHLSEPSLDTLKQLSQKRGYLHELYYSDNPIKYQSDQDLFRKLTEAHIAEKEYRDVLYGAESYNWSRITRRDYSNIDEALNPSCHKSQSIHYIMIRSLYELSKHQTEACYRKCRDHFERHHISLDSTTCHISLSYMKRYITTQLTDLETEWYNEIYWVYKFGLDHGYYLFNGTLDTRFYTNMINVLALRGDYEDMILFAEEHSSKLDRKLRAPTLTIAKGIISFTHERYDEVIALSSIATYVDKNDELRMKPIYIISYIESDYDIDFVDTLIYNAMRYLSRNKNLFSKKYHESHYNLFTYLKEYNVARKIKRDSPIQYKRPIALQSWLKRKGLLLEKVAL